MALKLINKSDTNNKGVSGLPDTPGLTASQMQKKFDELSTDVIIPKFNENMELLNAEDGADELTMTNPDAKRFGTGTAKGIATVIRKVITDLYALSGKYMTPKEGLDARFDEKADKTAFTEYKQTVNSEISSFEQAVASSVDSISLVAEGADEKSDTANETANTALDTANEAKTIAGTANQNSQDAVETANKAKSAVDSFESAVQEAKEASAQAVAAADEAKEAAEEASRSATKIDDTQISNSTTYSSQKIENEMSDVTHYTEVSELGGEIPGINANTLGGEEKDYFASKNEVDMTLNMGAIPEGLGNTVGGAIGTLNADLNDVRNTRLIEGYFSDSVTNNNRNSPYITPRAGYFRNAYNTACTMAFVLPTGTSQSSDYVMLNVPSGQTMSIFVPKGIKLYCQVGSGIFIG